MCTTASSRSGIRNQLSRLAILWAGLCSGLGGVSVMGRLFPGGEFGSIYLLALPTGLLACLAIWRALRVEHTATVVPATVGLCVVAGILNTPCSLLITFFDRSSMLPDGSLAVLGTLALATVLGTAIAVPAGLVFGLFLSGPVTYAARLREEVSFEATDRAGMAFSVMTLVSAVAAQLLHVGRSIRHDPSLPSSFFAVWFGLGLATLLAFGMRLWWRRRFLARVRARKDPRFDIDPIVDPRDAEERVPLIQLKGEPTGILVEIVRSTDPSTYRTSDARIPRALV